MVNDLGGSGGGINFRPVKTAQNVKFGKVNLNAKASSYNSFLNQTGLISNESTVKLYQQYKSTGLLIYQNNKPVLQVETKFDVLEAIKSGLIPVKYNVFETLQNEAQDKYNQSTD